MILAGEAVSGDPKESLDHYREVPVEELEKEPQRSRRAAWQNLLTSHTPEWEMTDDEPILSVKTADERIMDRLEAEFKDVPGVTIKRTKREDRHQRLVVRVSKARGGGFGPLLYFLFSLSFFVMIHIYTLQLSRWRLAKKNDIHILNITAKSGLQCFAPEFNLVMQYKQGRLSEAEYTEAYLEKMRRCYVQYRNEWEKLQSIERMAITCYCPEGQYCHRHLFKGCLTKFLDVKGIAYEDHGELAA